MVNADLALNFHDGDGPMDGNKVKLSCESIMENGSKRCTFQTSKLKKSKAKQRLAAHIFAKHSKDGGTLHSVTQEELPTALQSLDEGVPDGEVPIGGTIHLTQEELPRLAAHMFASGGSLHSVTQEERPTALQSLDEGFFLMEIR